MKIVSFVEGAYGGAGGIGMVGVPHICYSLAARGHDVILTIGGPPILGSEPYLAAMPESSLRGEPNFKILTFPAYGKWSLAPSLPPQAFEHVKTADFISLHSLYSFPVLSGYFMSKSRRKPYGVWPHGVLAPFQRLVGRGKKAVYDRLFARRILNNASVLFYTATGEREEAADLGLKPPSVVVPHGMDMTKFSALPVRGQFRDRYLAGHSGPLLVYVGRLNAKKGLDLLIEAFESVANIRPDARLAIVGPPDPPAFEGEVRSKIINCNLTDKVSLTGFVPETEKMEALVDADVFVLPSYAENFAFAMFEALACRVPVVISETLNFAHEIRDHCAGSVCSRSSSEFARAVLELLDRGDLREKMGKNGRRLADSYAWDRTGIRVEQTIHCLLAGVPLPAHLSEES